MRYGPTELAQIFAPHFDLIHTRAEEHLTPAGFVQPFTWIALSPSSVLVMWARHTTGRS